MTLHENVLWRIKIVVFFDFLGVSLVVPLLSSYFRAAGVSTQLYGLISSLYAASQMVGGLAIGSLADILSPRDILILSLLGSAFAYCIVGLSSSLWLLFVSRVVVGLVKQTFTVAATIVSEYSPAQTRAKQIGHISAAATLAFIVGPSVGALLYKHDAKLPALLSSLLFLFTILLVVAVIPRERGAFQGPAHTESQPGVIAVLRELTSVSGLGPLLGTLALISFLNRSMATSNVLGYYEKRFGVPTYQLGFLSSIYALASLVAQSFLVGPAARILGERRAIIAGLMCAALGNAAEGATQTVYQYLIFSLPITVCATSVVSACSKSLISMVAPRQHIGKCLGVVDIIGSTVGIPAPLYGGALFSIVGVHGRSWLSAAHYLCVASIAALLLPTPQTASHSTEEHAHKADDTNGTHAAVKNITAESEHSGASELRKRIVAYTTA